MRSVGLSSSCSSYDGAVRFVEIFASCTVFCIAEAGFESLWYSFRKNIIPFFCFTIHLFLIVGIVFDL